jgi:Flp pilus assembly protein TadD
MQDQIIQALRQNEADQAVQLAQAWTRDEPGQAEAHRWLALALQQQGKAEDAMEALQQALQLAPDNAQLHLQHAGLLLALRQFDGAGEALTRTTGLDPNAFAAYLMQAHLAIGRNDFDEAQRLSTLASRVEPDHPELLTIDGMIALRRDDADRALALLSAANQALPNDIRVLYALGFAYLGKNMLAFAEQAFRRVLELNPTIASLHGLVVQLAMRQGNLDAAAEAMQSRCSSRAWIRRRCAAWPANWRCAAASRCRRWSTCCRCWNCCRPRRAADAADVLAAPGPRGRGAHAWMPLEQHPAAARPVAGTAGGGRGRQRHRRRHGRALDGRDAGHLPALEARLRLHDMVGEHAQAEAIAERIVSLEPGRVSGETRLVEGLLQRDPAAAVARVQALIEHGTGRPPRRPADLAG